MKQQKHYLVEWTIDAPHQAGSNSVFQIFNNTTLKKIEEDCQSEQDNLDLEELGIDENDKIYEIKEITKKELDVLSKYISTEYPVFPD